MRRTRNPTAPSPATSNLYEIGLLTEKEFLHLRNPGNKFHESDSYDSSLEDLNRSTLSHAGTARIVGGNFLAFATPTNDSYVITTEDRVPVAVVSGGILYYEKPSLRHKLPSGYRSIRNEWVNFDIKSDKRIKYLSEIIAGLDNIKKHNLEKYNNLIQNIIIGDRSYQIRSEGVPVSNQGTSLAIINDLGEIVAVAQNEWGATLVITAREYRKLGLGKIIGKVWYSLNPTFKSGGFTAAGRNNAIAMWQDRVREFLANGWYSDLVRQGKITKARVKAILAGLPATSSRQSSATISVTKRPTDICVFVEYEKRYWGPTFIIYDSAFFDDPDEKFIHAFGFFRDSEHVGSFLYTIDYDRPYAEMATYVALQMARNNNEPVYVGPGYADMLELDGISHIMVDGNYVRLTQDVLDLGALRRHETAVRRRTDDKYEQKFTLLMEMAHSKWSIQ